MATLVEQADAVARAANEATLALDLYSVNSWKYNRAVKYQNALTEAAATLRRLAQDRETT